MDISRGWLKSDIHTWIYPWISISTASLAVDDTQSSLSSRACPGVTGAASTFLGFERVSTPSSVHGCAATTANQKSKLKHSKGTETRLAITSLLFMCPAKKRHAPFFIFAISLSSCPENHCQLIWWTVHV